ncbi:hypothetical protein T484DRAFT_2183429 [Baffinella frigidus]|nr:hypothetical protein T484DRAFT_2183429 [Cryptophyta sp. CCMP2293]
MYSEADVVHKEEQRKMIQLQLLESDKVQMIKRWRQAARGWRSTMEDLARKWETRFEELEKGLHKAKARQRARRIANQGARPMTPLAKSGSANPVKLPGSNPASPAPPSPGSMQRRNSMRTVASLSEAAAAELAAEAAEMMNTNAPAFRPIAITGDVPRFLWVRVSSLFVDATALSYVGGFNGHQHQLEVKAGDRTFHSATVSPEEAQGGEHGRPNTAEYGSARFHEEEFIFAVTDLSVAVEFTWKRSRASGAASEVVGVARLRWGDVRLDETGQVQANLDLARAEGAGGSVGKGKVGTLRVRFKSRVPVSERESKVAAGATGGKASAGMGGVEEFEKALRAEKEQAELDMAVQEAKFLKKQEELWREISRLQAQEDRIAATLRPKPPSRPSTRETAGGKP